MGNYSYMCKCGQPIRAGEKVHLMHVRHGEVLGHAEGEFDGYGSVIENEGFNNASFDKWDGVSKNDPNCHDEIMKSRYNFNDSEHVCQEKMKIYQGEPVSIEEYCTALSIATKWPDANIKSFNDACAAYRELEDAPKVTPQSGVAAYHKACYDEAVKQNAVDIVPSEADPNQGWGEPQKRFM